MYDEIVHEYAEIKTVRKFCKAHLFKNYLHNTVLQRIVFFL